MVDRFHPSEGTVINVPKAFVQSLALHLVVVIAFTLKAFLMPDEPISLKNAIRVDMVALPDKRTGDLTEDPEPTTPDQKKISMPAEEVPAKPLPDKEAPPTVNISEKKKSDVARETEKNQAIARLKAFKLLEEESKKKTMTNPSAPKKELWAGNIITSGTSLTGVEKIQHQEYITQIDRYVKDHWTLPQWLANGNFSAVINVRLDQYGNVIRKEIVTSSGNRLYDEKALEAVTASSPFPAPPKKFVYVLENEGVDFGFFPK